MWCIWKWEDTGENRARKKDLVLRLNKVPTTIFAGSLGWHEIVSFPLGALINKIGGLLIEKENKPSPPLFAYNYLH